MIYSEETLMAFADGELDAQTATQIEAALKTDAHLAQRVASHRALREDVFAAFAPILEEPVPLRLREIAKGGDAGAQAAAKDSQPVSATVLSFDALRAAKRPVLSGRRSWSWPEWGAIAATLLAGVMAGKSGLIGPQSAGGPSIAAIDGHVAAQGKLDQALSSQLASEQAQDGAVRIGVSFRSKNGEYCRSFAMSTEQLGPVLSGLACASSDHGRQWQIPVLVQNSAGPGADYRMAKGDTPAAVLQAIDDRIAGKTLDADAERAAVKQGWQGR